MRKTTAIFSILAPVMFALPARAEIASQQYVDDQKDIIINGTATIAEKEQIYEDMEISSGTLSGIANTVNNIGVTGAIAFVDKMTQGEIQDQINNVYNDFDETLFGSGSVAAENHGKIDPEDGGMVGYIDNAVAGDNTPTKNSNNLVKSGGVYDILASSVGKQQGNSRANGILATDGVGTVYVATGGHLTNSNISSSAAIEMGKIAMPTPPAVCENAGCMLMYVHGQYTWEVVTRNTGETPTVTAANAVSATPTQTSDPKAYTVQPCGNNKYWDGEACQAFAM